MSDQSWVLRGIDPRARQQAEEEAARLGMSLADYLTDRVVKRAVLDQLSAAPEADQTQSASEDAAIFAPASESPESFAVRKRLKALERRLSTAVGSLDGAIHALDTSLFDITARVGDVEALAGDTAHALGQTQQEVNNAIAGLQIQLAVLEDNLGAQGQAQETRAAGLDRRIDGVEHIARGAERSAGVLADAHEALKHAVAEDFAAFTHETADRLNAGLAEVRAAADSAAQQADAAVGHLINELRGLRVSIERRLEESAEETRERMHAAFADAADRMAALADRVIDNERLIARTADQLRAQVANVEDRAQAALEETAHALRQADAALTADLTRASQEHYAALEAARSELAAQIGAVREDQLAQLARLKLVDVAVGNTVSSLGEVRVAAERSICEMREALDTRVNALGEMLEQRIAGVEEAACDALSRAGADWDQRFDTVASRLSRSEQHAEALQQRLATELDRIEASAFAALEKLRRDIGAGDAALAQRLESALDALRSELLEVRNRAMEETHLLREEHTGALARLTLLDTALTRLEGATITTNGRIEQLETAAASIDPALEQRLAQLEYAIANAETEQAFAIMRDDVAALAARVSALSADNWAADRIAELQRRLNEQGERTGELNESLQGVARMLNRVAAQSVETAQRAEERAHQLEVTLADLRLEALSNSDANHAAAAVEALKEQLAASELRHSHALDALRDKVETNDTTRAVQTLQDRMTAFELRHANALDTLRADIARFVSDNDRRLEALESNLGSTGTGDLAAAFESLRTRIEERVLGVELRSVRTLEQVVDTVALLEQRLLSAEQDKASQSA